MLIQNIDYDYDYDVENDDDNNDQKNPLTYIYNVESSRVYEIERETTRKLYKFWP